MLPVGRLEKLAGSNESRAVNNTDEFIIAPFACHARNGTEEEKNTLFCTAHEKLHAVFCKGFMNISGTL